MLGLRTTSSSGWLDLVENGLCGVHGAQVAVSRIHPTVSRLRSQPSACERAEVKVNLAHNPLGDDGLAVLVEYLRSDEGSGIVSEVSLAGTGLGAQGLGLLSTLVDGNETLRSLDVAQVRVPPPLR
jgi:hypothetical protein